ncbi:hypothetical protein Slin15195_G093700 [Septoria linicola]|uniref:Uncharacterized protein n=1 Tax=Septoria linicola TaxID=215465 RepID=A0A9Q9B493_9PEZI|nr:hypothetical protein Slin15195_G093700 [Septoria linicola]
MALAEALEQDNNARERVTGKKASEPRPIDPSVRLRGEIAEAWQSIERRSDVAAYLPRRPSHDKATEDPATSCICDIQVFGNTTPSTIDGNYTAKPCDLVTPKSSSARSSVRLNRFERHSRYNEDMHLLIIRRQLRQQSDGELKFRTDFEACFKEFPLDKAFEPHWTCRTPVSAQASSVRSRTRTPHKPPVRRQQVATPTERNEDLAQEECNVYEFAKVNGLMNDVLLPRNSDGTLMAELDASPTKTSFTDVTSIGKDSPPASVVVNTSAAFAPHIRSERLTRKVDALRPLSWAKRASMHLKQIRQSTVQVPQERTSDSQESSDSTTQSPWTITATEDGILYRHSTLDELATPATAMSFTSDTGQRTSALLAQQHLSIHKECDESDSESDNESMNEAEEVVVGGCWISIASHEQ